MPVSASEIMISRLIIMAITAIVMSALFFTVFYAASPTVRADLAVGPYICFALIWTGYSLTAGSLYMYLQYGFREKVYLLLCIAIVLLFIAGPLLLALFGYHVVTGTVDLARQFGPVCVIAALAVSFSALYASAHYGANKILKRDLR
jgi:ABC-type transport system involved in multi-copper enzyme maturation permease subunit